MKKIVNRCSLLLLATTTVATLGCKQEQVSEGRELRRRVQMRQVDALAIQLPQGGTFDFKSVANAQMYDVLTKTQSFSTATVDPNDTYDPSGLSDDEAAQFNQCNDIPDPSGNNSQGKIQSIISQRAACMMDIPQGVVTGSILDFSLTNKKGLTFRLSQLPNVPVGIGLNFQYSKYELAMAMRVMHPLERGGIQPGDRKVIATSSKGAFGKESSGSFDLSFAGFEIGPSYYYKSSMASIVKDGLTSAITDLRDQWNAAEPWYAMVLRNCDKTIYINAGNATDAGLMIGDIVRIQNVDYRWNGSKTCEGDLMASTDAPFAPVGYARVTSVGTNMSIATIIEDDPNYPHSPDVIQPGARVYMEKMEVPVPQGQN